MSTRDMFHTVEVANLVPDKDVFLGLPVESAATGGGRAATGGGNRPGFHRVPIRSAVTESPSGDHRVRVQFVPGSTNVVQSCQGLQRLLLRFPNVFVPGVKVFEANTEGDRTNLSMGFALYDYRQGPTPEEERVLQNIDALALFLRSNIIRCDRIRQTLKLGPDNMTSQQQQATIDMMDLHVARPAMADRAGRARSYGNSNGDGGAPTVPPRYCYVKLVAPDENVLEKYHTYFFTEAGQRVPFEAVRAFRNFHVVPLVEPEDIFVSKAVRSIQLKLREAIVYPPAERVTRRPSVLFPNKVCRLERDEEPDDLYNPGTAASDDETSPPTSKRPRRPSPVEELEDEPV